MLFSNPGFPLLRQVRADRCGIDQTAGNMPLVGRNVHSDYTFLWKIFEVFLPYLSNIALPPTSFSPNGRTQMNTDIIADDHRFFILRASHLLNLLTSIFSSCLLVTLSPCHYFFRVNGIPNPSRSARASSSFLAEVTIAISIPNTFLILSYSISGKIVCSVRPKL